MDLLLLVVVSYATAVNFDKLRPPRFIDEMSVDFNDAISSRTRRSDLLRCGSSWGHFPWSFDEKNLHKNASNVFLLWCFDRMLDGPKC